MRVLYLLLMVAIIIAARIPFLNQPLVGEEGAFAALVASEVPSSEQTQNKLPQMLVGAIGGEPIYYSFQRSIAPYFIIEKTSGALVRLIRPVGISDIIFWARMSYFMMFIAGILAIVWRATKSLPASTVLFFALTTPLAVGASIQPQIDGSTSVLVTALGAIAVILANRKNSGLAAILGGVIIALGRPELLLALAAAAIALASLLRLGKLPNWLPLTFLAGLALGAAGSIALSPTEYFLTFTTMTRVYGTDTSAMRAIERALPYIWPVWLLGVIASIMAISSAKKLAVDRPDILLVLAGSLAIAAGFSVSGWSGDGFPRYYISAQVGFLICIVEMMIAGLRARWWHYSCAAVSLLGLWFSFTHLQLRYDRGLSITSLPGYPLQKMVLEIEDSAKRSRETGQIVMEQAALWLYHPEADFISADFGRAEAIKYLSKHRPADLPRLVSDRAQ